jgi:hypothetical protein
LWDNPQSEDSMADPEDYVYCNNDLEVHAGDRTSYKTAGWWSTNMASEGMCNWSVCGAGDVRDWFAAANKYIRGDGDSFKNHFDRYKSNIQMSQGAASVEQQQVIKEAQGVLDGWANYAKHFKTGGGGPVGSSFQTGGFSWEPPGDAEPEGPGVFDRLSGDQALELSREIVDYYDSAACLRDKFNETRPDGMLHEAPGYGGVTKRPPSEAPSEGMSVMQIGMMGLGAWIVIKALSE